MAAPAGAEEDFEVIGNRTLYGSKLQIRYKISDQISDRLRSLPQGRMPDHISDAIKTDLNVLLNGPDSSDDGTPFIFEEINNPDTLPARTIQTWRNNKYNIGIYLDLLNSFDAIRISRNSSTVEDIERFDMLVPQILQIFREESQIAAGGKRKRKQTRRRRGRKSRTRRNRRRS
jgi:hypothetical protein